MRIALAAAVLLLITACTGTPSSTSASTPAPPPAAPTSTASPAQTAQQAPPATSAAAPAVKTCTVPNVVGMIHQTAQDTMQAAGLFFLREEDASGQGRMLINDRNWKTTAQSVAAGTVVDCNTQIKLSATKIDG